MGETMSSIPEGANTDSMHNTPATLPEGSAAGEGKKVRRKILPVIDREFQLRITLFFMLLIILSHAFLLAIHFQNLTRTAGLTNGKTSLEIAQLMAHEKLVWTVNMIAGIVVIGIMVGMVVFYLTQKISGPLYAMSKALDEFAQGNLEARARLRKGDELQWFGKRVNEFLDQLAAKMKN